MSVDSSSTGCFLDIADHSVPTSDGGVLLHLLTDSQWVLEWLLYLGPNDEEAVVTGGRFWGYETVDDDDDPSPVEILVDGSSSDVAVCAESLAEFLRRLWIEEEIFFRSEWGRRFDLLDDPFRTYAHQLGLT